MLSWLAGGLKPTLAACAPAGAYAPGSVMVGFRDRAAAQSWQSSLWKGDLLEGIPVRAVQVAAGQECAAVEKLRRQPGVAFAELDYAASANYAASVDYASSNSRALQAEGGGLDPAAAVAPTVPNDPEWARQWGLAKIRLPEAWSLTTGSPEVVIAVLDSGVQTDHPDLAAKLWTNPGEIPGNQSDDDGNGKVDDVHGWHFFHMWNGSSYLPVENGNVQDDFGHGTHTAGIAGAETDNGMGVAGAAWGARLMPVKVLDQHGSGWYSDIAAGIIYAAENGARILNLSLGGTEDSQMLRAAVDYAIGRGVLVVAATGNTGGAVLYPAAYAPVLAVAATDVRDGRATFSNYGPQVDLAAPGVDITSTWYRSNYFSKSGTSMAAPHAAGAAALVWSRWPDLTAGQVITALLGTAVDNGAPGFDAYTGWGRVDAFSALLSYEPVPDLWVQASAPAAIAPRAAFTYTFTYGNQGAVSTSEVVISATLPAELDAAAALRWQVGDLDAHTGPFTITLPVTLTGDAPAVTSTVQIAGTANEILLTNNFASASSRTRLPATAGFIPGEAQVFVGQPVAFVNATTGSEPVTYQWNFGDGETSQAKDPVHIYSSPGVYNVTLLAANDLGADRAQGVVQVVAYILYFPFAGQ